MEHKTKGPYQVLSSRNVYENPWVSVREDRVIRPGGKEGYFGIIELKAGSTVLALTPQSEVYLVQEYKYGIERNSIELMSGALEASETPLEAARRELKEELGLEAIEWIDLGMVNPFTTAVHAPNYMFLALGVREGESNPDEGEVLEIIKTPFSNAIDMVMRSEITHSASCVLILKADRYLRCRETGKGQRGKRERGKG
jgi:8-oxo-dGTP pyrophosphatase MutT (NUDIX family)